MDQNYRDQQEQLTLQEQFLNKADNVSPGSGYLLLKKENTVSPSPGIMALTKIAQCNSQAYSAPVLRKVSQTKLCCRSLFYQSETEFLCRMKQQNQKRSGNQTLYDIFRNRSSSSM